MICRNMIKTLVNEIRKVLLAEVKQDTQKEKKCPPATTDAQLNTKNRNKAIKKLGYGPANPGLPNKDFWEEKAEMWDGIPVSDAKTMLCGNCAAFDISPHMKKCIKGGLDEAVGGDETIKAGQLGYCHMHKFKCAAKRTCDTWVTGGPIKK